MSKKFKSGKLLKISPVIFSNISNIYSETITIESGNLTIVDSDGYNYTSKKDIQIDTDKVIDIDFILENIANFDGELEIQLKDVKKLHKVSEINVLVGDSIFEKCDDLKIKNTGSYKIVLEKGNTLSENSKITVINENGITNFNIGGKILFINNYEINKEYFNDENILNFIKSKIGEVETTKNGTNLNFNDINLEDYLFTNVGDDFKSTKVVDDFVYNYMCSTEFLETIKSLKKIDITIQKKRYYNSIIFNDFQYLINEDSDEYKNLLNFINEEIKKSNYSQYDELCSSVKSKYEYIKKIFNENETDPIFIDKSTEENDEELYEYYSNNDFLIEGINELENCKLLKHRTNMIEFIIPENCTYVNENIKNSYTKNKIDFVDDKINEDTNVRDFIKAKYFNYLSDEDYKNIKIEAKINDENYIVVKSNNIFDLNISNYKVTISGIINGIIKEKEKSKINININFDVDDNVNFKLNKNVVNKDDIKLEEGKTYDDLLDIIKKHLDGKELKEGFKIYKKSKDTNIEFTTGVLENNTTYIVVFDNEDTNFVEEKPAEKKLKGKKTKGKTDEGEKIDEEKPTERKPTEEDKPVEREKPTGGNPTDEKPTDEKPRKKYYDYKKK